MTERSPAPEDVAQTPVKKPARNPWTVLNSHPWTALIAIVILGAVAIAVLRPTYEDYADRLQVAEATILLKGTKAPLTDYYETHKKWPPSLICFPGKAQSTCSPWPSPRAPVVPAKSS